MVDHDGAGPAEDNLAPQRGAPSMRHPLSIALFSLALATIAGESLADEAPAAPPRITVEVSALRNAKGVVRCSIWTSPDGFPKDPTRALASVNAPSIANGHATCVFDNVKPGTYAVGYIHDENGNGK